MVLANMLTESDRAVATGTYVFGTGNQKGDMVNARGNGMPYRGLSFFAEAKLKMIDSSIIGRYDWFKWGKTDTVEPDTTRFIAGYAWHFLGHNRLLLDVDAVKLDLPNARWDWNTTLTLQVKYP